MDLKDLIMNNQNLIYKLTHYFKNYENKEDLFQAGCIGMVKAYKKYDSSFNVKFTTFAFPYILGEMKKFAREDKGIKISKDISRLNSKIEQATIILSQKLMREPTIDELSSFLDISTYDLAEAINSTNNIMSIDEVINNDGKEVTLHDIIKDKETDLDSLIALRSAIKGLSDFEKELIGKRYYKDMTQKEVAECLGISQVQVSRKEQKVLTKLKSKIAS
ncbi:MAG: sigma-70 family RNA polymerase sigma factor [Firmicutes bacterium]|nr:sigma-70 family RNA polymerase sigma factor [Bacillota bacterium]